MTRREFVLKASRYGGSAFSALTALGLISRASGQGADLSDLPRVSQAQSGTVIIMGAGIAGMTAAYELDKLGIDSVILEPAERPGGRCLTIRRGTTITETTGHTQTCAFDEGHYFNPGPSRFPQWHITMDYCRELGVAVEPFVNLNENAYYYVEGEDRGDLSGRRVRIREAKTDLRGYTAELLAKVIDQDSLDADLEADDVEALLEYLRFEGGLQPDLFYRGHARRGYDTWPGAGEQEGELGDPYPLAALIRSGMGNFFHRANEYQYQAQMFTPSGGMDKLAEGLAAKVQDKIRYGARVTEIRRGNPGARVVFEQNGTTQELTGDFGICTIPPTILRRLATDFSPPLQMTLNVVPFQNAGKIGLQFKRRFWEEDDRIFGGLSWTNLPIGEVWYPSTNFLSKKGVMGGYYVFGPTSDMLGNLPPEERTAFALEHGSKLHPQYQEAFENAFSVNWATLPHIEGCLAHFPQAMLKTFYPLLTRPEGELYIAASWASHLGGWQAGAFETARRAVKDIHTRMLAA